MKLHILVLLLGLAPAPLSAQSTLERVAPEIFRFQGTVDVVDGDTIDMLTQEVTDLRGRVWGGRVERLRIQGIDAPERREPGAAAAADYLASLAAPPLALACICETKESREDYCQHDRYGRVIVTCRAHLSGTTRVENVGREMVRLGLARARYGCHYEAEHRDACAAKRGLWAQGGDCEPRCDWR